MDKAEFFAACASHDWYYNFSDDMRVYTAGQRAQQALQGTAASGGDECKAIYKAWKDYINANIMNKPISMPNRADFGIPE